MDGVILTPKQATLRAAMDKVRSAELESIVLQDPIAACYHAKNVVKGRWPDAEPVIAKGLDKRYGDFNILDEDKRPVMGHSYRVGQRPAGTDHVSKGNNLRLMVVYMRLAKCRVPAFEAAVASARWKGPTFDYCKLVHRLTGELIDLDSPEVCAWMIRDFCYSKSYRMPRSERIRLSGELHKRMILHSFAKGDNREVRKYFSECKRSENRFLVMLDQADKDITVGDFMKKMMES